MDSISIQIPSILDNLRLVESFIDNAKDRFQLDDDIYGNIMVSVIESVNNAIVHGNKSDSTKNVSLSLSFQENAIQFYVEDEGSGFDYSNLPDPTSPENLDNPGGRGIFLIKNLCDEVDFANSGRTLTLTFYIN